MAKYEGFLFILSDGSMHLVSEYTRTLSHWELGNGYWYTTTEDISHFLLTEYTFDDNTLLISIDGYEYRATANGNYQRPLHSRVWCLVRPKPETRNVRILLHQLWMRHHKLSLS